MTDQVLKLGLYETLPVVRQVVTPGVYQYPLHTVGNAVLSSVYVRSGAGSATVRWFDYGASNTEEASARIDLDAHPTLVAGQSDRRLISRLHNHGRIELEVTGAPVEVYILATLVADFPVDVDVQVQGALDGQTSNPLTDTGLGLSILDPSDGKFYLARGPQGAIRASISGLRVQGRVTEVTLNPTTWTALPSTALPMRNALGVQNRTGTEIKVNYDPTVVGYVGMVIPDLAERQYDVTEAITLYGKSQVGTVIVAVEELS